MHLVTHGVGRIGKVFTNKYIPNRPISFTIITNERHIDHTTGEWKETVHSCLANCWVSSEEQYHARMRQLYVGNLVQVTGHFDTGYYQDAQGNGVYSPRLNVSRIEILEQRRPKVDDMGHSNNKAAASAHAMAEAYNPPANIPVTEEPPAPSAPKATGGSTRRPKHNEPVVPTKRDVPPVGAYDPNLDDDLPF